MTATTIGQRFDVQRPVARSHAPGARGRHRLWSAGALATAIAVGGCVLAYAAARWLGVSFLMAQQPGATPTPLPMGMVVAASALGALAATAAFGVLRRLSP